MGNGWLFRQEVDDFPVIVSYLDLAKYPHVSGYLRMF